jgi:hypothetical protein
MAGLDLARIAAAGAPATGLAADARVKPGHDEGGRGNDEGGCGNDEGERGNDESRCRREGEWFGRDEVFGRAGFIHSVSSLPGLTRQSSTTLALRELNKREAVAVSVLWTRPTTPTIA